MLTPAAPRRELAGVLAFFAVLTGLLTYPLSLSPGSTSITNDPDVHTMVWTLAWDAHAFLRQPFSIFDANIFYPYERTLAFSENLIGSAFFAAPVIWLTDNPVLAMNVVALLSCVLCGVGAFVLGRQLGLSIAASLVCGIIFAFSPARFLRFPQLHLTAIQWLPFSLAFLIAYVEHGRARDLRIALAFFTLQALTSGHGAVYLVVAFVLVAACRFALGTPLAARQRIRDVGVPGAVLLLPAALILPPYLHVQRELGLRRSLVDWETAPESFLASPTHAHQWLLDRVAGPGWNDAASAFLFPGWLPLLLAVVALMPGRLPIARGTVVMFLILIVVGVLLSAGPPLSVWPYVYWMPGLNFIRVPSRFFLLAVLGIAVLAAVGAERLLGHIATSVRRGLAAAACACLIAEFAIVPLPVHPFPLDIPSVDSWLATQPRSASIVEVPVGPYTRYHSTYMLHSMAHWRRTVHGHSSLLPVLHQSLYADLRAFPDENTIYKLEQLGIDFVVVHTDMYAPGEWELVEQRLERFKEWFTLQHVDGAGRIYAFRGRAVAGAGGGG
jgi:hypothetical protein